MTQLNTAQVAELLIGIARAQQAIIDAIESQKAGFKTNHLTSALQSAAHIRDVHRRPTLADLPARILMQCQGRVGPSAQQVARDLEEMLGAQPVAAARSAVAAAPPAADENSLDMT